MPLSAVRERGDQPEEERDEEDADRRREEHPREHTGTQ
jgi:hypothetical protein